MEMVKLLVLGKVLEITCLLLLSFLYSSMFAVLAQYLTYLESGHVAFKCDGVILLISCVLEGGGGNNWLFCYVLRHWE